ncbi:hypothetical protein R523_19055 [Salmonella enterica subsp. enterica serovar Holcomb]|nr:hypothetical protein SEEI0720_010280 [Salmonella enterica subsp. enterica serovar Inverness str. ATCC 10720]OSD29997.1 hypothetical protein R535_23780 [Salmonella enterica subsp. enterica serovar Holcomb]OSE03017.1 hypothetical protein R523_19055 [Salmonella enterica subsp. enterica serovar Holcomb]OSE69195.1 hypothetical protein R593_24605 [Salmonella enterica subsp. enterica serovar Newport]OSG71871.1 hypothetical protein R547_18130 [Salmonella enterica subsp. enterica serovar Newport]
MCIKTRLIHITTDKHLHLSLNCFFLASHILHHPHTFIRSCVENLQKRKISMLIIFSLSKFSLNKLNYLFNDDEA